MVSRTDTAASTDRRSFLAAAGATVVGGMVATGTVAAADSASFHLTQGETCIPLHPFQGDKPVKEFYDYREDRYSSYGTQSLQRPNTSILFLYHGPQGVSLVVVHGKLGGNGDGGSVTFDVSGLPESGEWLIKDDSYDGPRRYDRWDIEETTATIDWTYDGGRADGAVFGQLGDQPSIEIDPAFNKHAALFGKHYDGTVTDWQALSGERSNPKRASLDKSKPIRIQSGGCPNANRGNQTRTRTTHPTQTAESTQTSTNQQSPTPTQSPTASGGTTSNGTERGIEHTLKRLSRFFERLSRFLNRIVGYLNRYL